MRRRIFIAINIDDKTKRFIETKISGWKETLPLKWIPKDNWHLTLAFLGYIEDQDLEQLAVNLKQAISTMPIFDIHLTNFTWGPKKERPKMLWLKGEKDENLTNLRITIETAVTNQEIDKKEFRPHITLARVSSGLLNKKPLLEIDTQTNIMVPVASVEIMESVAEKGKRKYYVMESIDLS